MNKFYFDDNLEILREMDDVETISSAPTYPSTVDVTTIIRLVRHRDLTRE